MTRTGCSAWTWDRTRCGNWRTSWLTSRSNLATGYWISDAGVEPRRSSWRESSTSRWLRSTVGSSNRHWELTGLVTDVTAWMQPGSRDDWVIWARAAGESDNSPLLTMLTSVAPDDIGFALVTAVKTPARADPSPTL